MCIYIYVHAYIYMYVYIYRERERERSVSLYHSSRTEEVHDVSFHQNGRNKKT